jgi:quercetin dioxygenase-like cupin family protein
MTMRETTAYNWNDIPSREPRPGIEQRGFRGDNALITYNVLKPGLVPKPHSHPFEQLFMIIQGRVTLHVGEQVFDCGPGTVIRIPPDVEHWAEAPKAEDGDAINIDVFAPVRDDYLPLVAYQEKFAAEKA